MAVLGAVLTGCTVPRPEVTFYGNFHTVDVEPALWCSEDQVTAGQCDAKKDTDTSKIGRLALKPGDSVQISVPGELSERWAVVILYADAAGKLNEATSGTLSGVLSYTVRPPAATDKITQVQVQSGAFVTQTGVFARQNWILAAS